MEEKFAAFILSHGRPDNVATFKTLRKCGYTGRIIFIIDNEDKTADKYIENFGAENVYIFDKKAEIPKTDHANNFGNNKIVVYARNKNFEIARELGIKYFVQLDDDYNCFLLRFPEQKSLIVKDMDRVFENFLEFYKNNPNLKSIAFSQGGDHIGGFNPVSKRKVMNSFFCSTEREFTFVGSINEDVNTYVINGSRGDVFLTINYLQLCQTATQTRHDGLTDYYLLYGTYVKSFITVLYHPSSVLIYMMTSKNTRLHHLINWKNTTPMIIDGKYKKLD